MNTVTVYVPCDVVSYQLRVGYGRSLSTMERTVLAVIEAQRADREARCEQGPVLFRHVKALLGAGHRVTLDLVHDLWRKGYLRVDSHSGGIELSPTVREHLDQGTFDQLGSAETTEQQADLMIDRLSGRVLPLQGGKSPAVPKLAVEPEPEDTTIEHVSRGELMAALLRSINSDRSGRYPGNGEDLAERPPELFERRQMNILSSRVLPPDASRGQRRWLPIDINVALDPDTERMTLMVVDRALTPIQRQLAAERLTALLTDVPTGSFARQLVERAQPALTEGQPLEDLLSDFAAQLNRLSTVRPDERHDVHAELGRAARQAVAALSEMIEGQVEVELIGPTNLRAELSSICASAEHQLVVVVPKLDRREWEKLDQLVREALARSVHVVLLWGDQPGSKLDGPVRNLLTAMVRQHTPTQFVLPFTSARSRTWMVVADDRTVLLGGSDLPERDAVTAVRLRAPDLDGQGFPVGSESVRRILGWVCRTVPDGQNSRLVMIRAEDFAAIAAPQPPRPVALLRLPEPPPLGVEDADSYAVHTWRELWTGVHDEISDLRAAVTRPVPRMIEDLRHSDVLWYALRNARHRLVIASERLDKGVADDLFFSKLRGRLAAGVEVTIAIPGEPPSRHPTGSLGSVRAQIAAVGEEFPHLMRVVPAAGRFLICDDDVVLGSFDMMRDGVRGAGRARHRRPVHLGLLVRDARLASRLSRIVGATIHLPEDQTPPAAARTPPDTDTIRARQHILNCRAQGGDVGEEVRRQMAATADPWTLLASLEGAADDHVIEVAIARCLVSYGDSGDPLDRARYRCRLVSSRWRAGDYVVAAALRLADPDPDVRPRIHLAVAAAAIGTPHLQDVLQEAVRDADLDVVERRALLAVSCRHLVRTGGGGAAAIVADLGGGLDGEWRELSLAVVECQAYLLDSAAADVAPRVWASARRGADLASVWDSLERALILASQPPKHLDGSIKTVYALFRSDAPLGMLLAACQRRDLAAVQGIVASAFDPADTPAALAADILDRTWDAVTANGSERLIGTPRAGYLNRLSDVVIFSRRLVAPDESPALRSDDPAAEAVRTLVARVATILPSLEPGTEEPGQLEQHLVRRELDAMIADLGAIDGGWDGSARSTSTRGI